MTTTDPQVSEQVEGGQKEEKAPAQAAPASSLQHPPTNTQYIALTFIALAVADLFLTGMGVNPTARIEAVYPQTPGVAFLQAHAGHERVLPVNRRWSLQHAPPAVLPPNAGMVYGLRDGQGYDSLLTAQYKAFASQLALPNAIGVQDASPPEVGNMVFIQNPNAPGAWQTGAAYVITLPPGSVDNMSAPFLSTLPLYSAPDEMSVYAMPNAQPRASLYDPARKDAAGIGSSQSDIVRWTEDTATRITLQIPDGGALRSLTLADQNFPGWHAQMDGKPVPILPPQPNSPFRTVDVPSGPHRVEFRYRPAGFAVGLYAACFALMLLCVPVGARLSQRRNTPISQ